MFLLGLELSVICIECCPTSVQMNIEILTFDNDFYKVTSRSLSISEK